MFVEFIGRSGWEYCNISRVRLSNEMLAIGMSSDTRTSKYFQIDLIGKNHPLISIITTSSNNNNRKEYIKQLIYIYLYYPSICIDMDDQSLNTSANSQTIIALSVEFLRVTSLLETKCFPLLMNSSDWTCPNWPLYSLTILYRERERERRETGRAK